MKKIGLLLFSSSLFWAVGMKAQNVYDANNIMSSNLNGTARFVGMGGAMGALGGDISTISTNPAGIGIYRSNDVMISFGFNDTKAESLYSGTKMDDNKFRGSFDNVGMVYSNKIGERTALKYVNVAFNYHKLKNFNRNMRMGGSLVNEKGAISQTDEMAMQSQGISPEFLNSDDAWYDGGIGWLSILGWKGYLTNYDQAKGNYYGFPGADPWADYYSEERGSVNEYDFNASLNISNQIYLGFTLGIYSVDYSRRSYYREGFDPINGIDDSFYTLDNWFETTGSGVDFKVGAIFRPFLEVPLRIGVAVHTPTLFNLRNVTGAVLHSDINGFYGDSGNTEQYEQYTVDTGEDAVTDYKLITPWKYNMSLGYTFGSFAALGVEYEYMDYSTSKLRYDDSDLIDKETDEIKEYMKGVHSIRIGAEFKPVSQFAVRLGYNHSTASMKDDAYWQVPNTGLNRIRTDTEYANTKSINNVTVGMGYRGNMFYADLAYQYSVYKADFYPFDNLDLSATKVTNSRNQLLFTLGMRF